MDLKDQAHGLRQRLLLLANDGDSSIPGADDLARGLTQIIDHLDGQSLDDPSQQRLALIYQGLGGLADLLEDSSASSNTEDRAEDSPDQAASDGPTGMAQFIETFRMETKKRLQGLSIAMMGLFSADENDDALTQSIDHLHAIRGGAAMVGIDGVADLSGAMEDFLNRISRHDAASRQWPTKTLLRGYALLEGAIEDPDLSIARDDAKAVFAGLRQATARLRDSDSAPTTPKQSAHKQQSSSPDKEKSATEPQKAEQSADTADNRSPTIGDGLRQSETSLEQPILIVDDMETIAASVAFILAELDVPIEIANHGEEAMQRLQEKPFSLVISDVDMPRMDGIALTRMIRADEALMQLPIILLTSLDHPEERQAGLEAGATDYLIKGSIGGGELLGRVRDLLEVAPVVERDERPEKKRILVAEDTETVAASIAFVLSEGPYEITLATDGKDARRKLNAQPYELLITDMQMPYMSGTELVADLRQDSALADLPVVMLTSVQDDELIAEAQSAGVDRYLIKGEIAGGRLLSIVEELLGT